MNLLSRVRALRKNEMLIGNVDEPFSNNIDTISGNRIRRRIVLKTRGCSVPTCTMCPLPDESVPVNTELSKWNLVNQIKMALTSDDIEEDVLTIYTNGNFFAEKEITGEIRRELYCMIAKRKAREIVVESLPHFVNGNVLDEFADICPGKKLVIAIGLQSYSDEVREYAINSKCRLEHFELCIDLLRDRGFSAQVFLMFGSPFLNEKEMIDDVLYSVNALQKYGPVISNIVISPLRVARNTVVQDLYEKGLYIPPSTASLLSLMDLLLTWNLSGNVRIATSILTGIDKIDSIRLKSSSDLIEKIKLWNIGEGTWFEPILDVDFPDGNYPELRNRVTEYLAQFS